MSPWEVIKKEPFCQLPCLKSGPCWKPGEAGKVYHTAGLCDDWLCSGPAGGQGAIRSACPRYHGLAISMAFSHSILLVPMSGRMADAGASASFEYRINSGSLKGVRGSVRKSQKSTRHIEFIGTECLTNHGHPRLEIRNLYVFSSSHSLSPHHVPVLS